ncbi:carboxypeptidase-like regulatory domain-containing protein, partial [Acinetobacter baumannii]
DSSSDIGAFDGGWDLVITPLNYLCSLSPTAAGATLSGRVVDESGRGVSGASVSISDGGEFAGFASTNSFGYFRIENVPVGRLYIVTAK